MGKITITTEGNITSEMFDEIPLFEGYTDYMKVTRNNKTRYVDPEMNEFLKSIINSHEKEFKEYVGKTDFDVLGASSKEHVMRSGENNLCDLITDSMKYLGNSDLALLNAGSIRNDLLKGNITYSNIIDVLPFANRLVVLEIQGKDLLDILEFGVRTLPGISSRFSQVSGIHFKVDDSIKSPVIVNDMESFDRIEGERRIYDVFIGNESLDENKNYTISVNDYLASGGDGYSMLSKYKKRNDTSVEMSVVLKDYIKNVLNESIPERYNNTQGRIIKEKKERKANNSNNFIKYYKRLSILLLSLVF